MSPYRLSTVESELRRHTPPTGQLPPSVWAAPDDSLVDDPMITWSSARLAGSATTPSKEGERAERRFKREDLDRLLKPGKPRTP